MQKNPAAASTTLNDTERAELARLREAEAKRTTISFKVSPKGGLSVYGLGRFPVTLYKSQWTRLIAAVPAISSFIAANDAALSEKSKAA
jgi:hypothetical protein